MNWKFYIKPTKKDNLLTIDYCVKKGFELRETFSYGDLDYSILRKEIRILNDKYILQLFRKNNEKHIFYGNSFSVAVRDISGLNGLGLQPIETENELHEVYEFLTKDKL